MSNDARRLWDAAAANFDDEPDHGEAVVEHLSQRSLWGREIDDERYLILSVA